MKGKTAGGSLYRNTISYFGGLVILVSVGSVKDSRVFFDESLYDEVRLIRRERG